MTLKDWRYLVGIALIGLILNGCGHKQTKKVALKPPPPTPSELLAIKHYKLGIDSYANDQYAEAIRHWKITVKEDPNNINAVEYIGRAENMIRVVKSVPKKKKPKPTKTPTAIR